MSSQSLGALQAVGRGLWVFPTAPGRKVPHYAVGEWRAAATSDMTAALSWWTRNPTTNPAVACKPSQLLVVDCDTAKADWNLRGTDWEYVHSVYGPRVNGVDLLDEVAFKLGDDTPDGDETYQVQTGSGGLHIYYRWPESWPKPSQSSIVKGVIDVRNAGGEHGGYVLGAGSVTLDETQRDGSVKPGGEYTALNDAPIQLPPTWLRQLVVEKPPPVRQPGLRGIRQPGVISFSGLQQTVANAAEGNRNNALLFCARAMCTDRATEQQCLDILGPAAAQNGLGDFEIVQTIRSAYRLQRHKDGA